MTPMELRIDYDDPSETSAIVYVEALVNGEPRWFVLDTGCAVSSLCLDERTRALPKVGERASSGSFGTELFDLVTVDELSFGPVLRRGGTLSRANNPRIDKSLLGMDVLGGRTFQLSYRTRTLQLDAPPPSGCRFESIDPDPRGGQPYVSVRLGEHTLKALWDTGAGITIADAGFVSENPTLFERVGESEGTDSTGTTKTTPTYDMHGLSLGGVELAPHRVAVIDLSHVNAKSRNPVSIGLGFSTLAQADWFFDFESQRWAISAVHR